MPINLNTSPETDALVEALRNVSLGGTVTYAALSDLIGIDVTGPARPRLVSARRIVLRDHGAAFETLREVGLQRLVPESVGDIGTTARGKIRRAARRARSGMTSVVSRSNGLSPDAARRMSAEMSALGLIEQVTSEKTVTAIAATTEKPAAPARVAETFLSHIRGAARRAQEHLRPETEDPRCPACQGDCDEEGGCRYA
ncbi:hypothetical protein ACN9JG_06110 [Cereibacter azotoformans]|uniref:hypothetical protein n=1 Tax=Cereibacter azotoformans TaxID=43057 RepID=UPI003B20C669